MGALAHPPIDAVFSVQQLAFDKRPAELAVVGPELPQDGVHLDLSQALAGWKRPRHLGEDQPAAAFASRPLDNSAVPPERAQLPHLLGSRVPTCGGHAPL